MLQRSGFSSLTLLRRNGSVSRVLFSSSSSSSSSLLTSPLSSSPSSASFSFSPLPIFTSFDLINKRCFATTSKLKKSSSSVSSKKSPERKVRIPPMAANLSTEIPAQLLPPPSSERVSPIDLLPLDSVVKVYADLVTYNHRLPWSRAAINQSNLASGFAIEGNKILTNAHAVAGATHVVLRKYGSPNKYSAKIEAVGHDCDLALLTVADPEFWEGITPLAFGGIPHLQEEVTVIGYPTGGDNVSVTQGIVSRIDLEPYVHGSTDLIAVQIDAAINPGNSGGPALIGSKVVGVAFQNLRDASDINFIIPVPVIQHFLEDLKRNKGKYQGFVSTHMSGQAMENPSMRKYYGLGPKESGVLVGWIEPTSPAANVIKKDDVVMMIEDKKIANDGTIAFRNKERILSSAILTSKFPGDTLNVTVMRDRIQQQISLPLVVLEGLVPNHMHDKAPSFYIYGGFVFVQLTWPYIETFGQNCPRHLWTAAREEVKQTPDQQIVVISQVLPCELTTGYSYCHNGIVTTFNGVKVNNLKHLVTLVESSKEPFLKYGVKLEDDGYIILESVEAKVWHSKIMAEFNWTKDRSDDLLGPPQEKKEKKEEKALEKKKEKKVEKKERKEKGAVALVGGKKEKK